MKEGPTTISHTTRTCGLCKWHRQLMLRSGMHPEYKHFCGHPASVTWMKERHPRELEFRVGLYGGEDGREIGDTDNTPEWCPVVGVKS